MWLNVLKEELCNLINEWLYFSNNIRDDINSKQHQKRKFRQSTNLVQAEIRVTEYCTKNTRVKYWIRIHKDHLKINIERKHILIL